jgi:hypothetical protein
MLSVVLTHLKARLFRLAAQSGSFVSSGSGMPASEEGPVPVLLGSLLGALGGILVGLIVSKLLRYVTFLTGWRLGGYSWVLYFALLGAIICGWLAASGDKS